MIMNESMKKIVNNLKCPYMKKSINIKVKDLYKLLLPEFKKIHDCIILSSETEEILKDNYKNELSNFENKTGYEIWHNEIIINSYIKDYYVSVHTAIYIALIIIEVWSDKLKNMSEGSKFCYFLSCSDNIVNLRFHKIREGERMWHIENLEEYVQPVGYIII